MTIEERLARLESRLDSMKLMMYIRDWGHRSMGDDLELMGSDLHRLKAEVDEIRDIATNASIMAEGRFKEDD